MPLPPPRHDQLEHAPVAILHPELAHVGPRAEDRDPRSVQVRDRLLESAIADYALPRFDGVAVLELVRELRPDVSVVLTSGVIDEDFAIETLMLGATDYVLKQRLDRLVPVVLLGSPTSRPRISRAQRAAVTAVRGASPGADPIAEREARAAPDSGVATREQSISHLLRDTRAGDGDSDQHACERKTIRASHRTKGRGRLRKSQTSASVPPRETTHTRSGRVRW